MTDAWERQLDETVALHQRGALDAAEAGYRALAAQAPDNPHPQHYLGLIALQRGDALSAASLIGEAIRLAPQVAEFHVNLGNALKRLGRLAEAVDAYRQALALRPGFFEAWVNLGLALESAGSAAEAAGAFQAAHQLRPDAGFVLTGLARVLLAAGRAKEALACSEQSLAVPRPVVESFVAHADLLVRIGVPHKAVRLLRKHCPADGGDAGLLAAFGRALDATGEYAAAVEAFRAAIRSEPASAAAWAGLAVALKNQGRIDDALLAYQSAIDHAPGDPGLRSSYLFTLLMADGLSNAELCAAHRDYGALFGSRVASLPVPAVRQDPGVLRIGYLSPDLRRHPIGFFLQGILAGHDRGRVEVTCYHTGLVEDEVSAKLRQAAQRWIPCGHLSDEGLAERIRADGIDVLVELSGHTSGNRLLALARRPAPVQVSYLGYAHATCLPWIDYRISDGRADPPDDSQADACEAVMRLPESYYCYTPPDASPAVGDAPSQRNGRLTFGAFLQLGKLSESTRDLWAAVLGAIPGARLLIRAKGLADRETRDALAAAFVTRGVARERIMLEGWQAHQEHLRAYRRVDCMLDTFPFNLATNTCEALWMGVPTITLAGDRQAARMGASLLGAIGLDDFVAESREAFVAIAGELAARPERLWQLRRDLRARLAGSSLMDGRRCAAGLEDLYLRMYRAEAARRAISS